MDKQSNDERDEDIVPTGEDTIEEETIVAEEEQSNDKIRQLREKYKTCEAEKAKYLEDLQRTKADFLNSKKRLEEQVVIEKERTLDSFVASLLPLCDSFDMALANQKAWEATPEEWRKGVEAIKSQLDSTLKQFGVTEITACGKHFDPNRHEAIASTDGNTESDIVLEVVQKGYERNGSIIRVAKVVIQN